MRPSVIADRIRGFYHASPFRPFDIVLTDDRRMTVEHPERIVVTNRMAAVAVGDAFEYVDLSDVKGMEHSPTRRKK